MEGNKFDPNKPVAKVQKLGSLTLRVHKKAQQFIKMCKIKGKHFTVAVGL